MNEHPPIAELRIADGKGWIPPNQPHLAVAVQEYGFWAYDYANIYDVLLLEAYDVEEVTAMKQTFCPKCRKACVKDDAGNLFDYIPHAPECKGRTNP